MDERRDGEIGEQRAVAHRQPDDRAGQGDRRLEGVALQRPSAAGQALAGDQGAQGLRPAVAQQRGPDDGAPEQVDTGRAGHHDADRVEPAPTPLGSNLTDRLPAYGRVAEDRQIADRHPATPLQHQGRAGPPVPEHGQPAVPGEGH